MSGWLCCNRASPAVKLAPVRTGLPRTCGNRRWVAVIVVAIGIAWPPAAHAASHVYVPSAIFGTIVPYSTASTVFSLFKFVPVVGTAVGPLTMAGVSMPATWIIGKVFIQHFASGGTLLDFNPPDYREFIKAQREKLGIRSAAPAPTADDAAPPSNSSTSPVA